jgi:hypothetical protein
MYNEMAAPCGVRALAKSLSRCFTYRGLLVDVGVHIRPSESPIRFRSRHP